MKKIPDINFVKTPIQHHQQEKWLWIIIGVVLFVQVSSNFWLYQTHQQELQARFEAKHHAVQTAARAKSPPLSSHQAETLASIQQMISHVTVPWEDMFSGIEAAYIKQIKLESLQPRPEQGEVTLIFSGPNFKSLSDFIAALANQSEFKDVRLQSEIVSDKNSIEWQANVIMKWAVKK